MEGVSEAELKKHPVTVEVQDEATGQMMEQMVGYRLDTELSIYEQEKPIRCVVEWDGKAGSKKWARLVIGVGQDEMDEEAVVDWRSLPPRKPWWMTLSHTPSSRCCGKRRSNRPLNDPSSDTNPCHFKSGPWPHRPPGRLRPSDIDGYRSVTAVTPFTLLSESAQSA